MDPRDADADEDYSDNDEDLLTYKIAPDNLRTGYDITPLELSVACLHVGITKSKSYGRKNDDFETFKIVAAQCALTELEIAIHQHEFAKGAATVASGTGRVSTWGVQ